MAVKILDAADDSLGGLGVIKKRQASVSIAVNSSIGSCDVLDCRQYSSLAIKPPTGCTGLTAYASESAAGTFVLVNDVGTNGAFNVTASVFQLLDAKLAPYGFLKFVAAGANGNAVVVGKT